MEWTKKGRIIEPGRFAWMLTHAQNPFPEHVGGDSYRIHFAGRNKLNMAQGGYTDVEVKNGRIEPGGTTKKPTLKLGDLGCFDDCGAMPSCIANHKGKQYMYYTGWTQQKATPFSFFIGLAASEDKGKTFERHSKAPVFGRTKNDPYLTASPWVIIEDGVWRMWYVSGTGWKGEIFKGTPKNSYHIRYAESDDGSNWESNGTICVDYDRRKGEYAVARPTVSKEGGLYRMFYSYMREGDHYRIGYAESEDGVKWERKDAEAGIDISKSGWDSEMVCYGCAFGHKGEKYLLYNGNRYGTTGCGYATLAGE